MSPPQVLVLGPTDYGNSFKPYHPDARLVRDRKPALEMVDKYLEQLTNTSFITDLGFFNGLIAEESSNNINQFCDIDYRLLDNVGSLRNLKITRVDSALRAWMDDAARKLSDLRKLRVTQLYSTYDTLLEEFNTLGLPRLSELSIREVTNVLNTSNLLTRVLDKPPECDALASHTILDRLPGHGRSLTKLAVHLDFATQWAVAATVLTAFLAPIQILFSRPMTHYAT
ncbi:hypothetical protein ACHAO1_002071 [Botrytis cinerea]